MYALPVIDFYYTRGNDSAGPYFCPNSSIPKPLILQGCTSVVPIRITAAFDALESRINVCNKRLVPSGNPKPRISWEKVYPALYHQLTLTIIGSKLWPYVVPGAEWAVDKTIVDFKNHDASLFKVLIDRAQVIDEEYNSLTITEMAPLVSA